MLNVLEVPIQEPIRGVTVIFEMINPPPIVVPFASKVGILASPLEGTPINELSLVHSKTEPVLPVKLIGLICCP